jgi:hypothetical protein
VAIPPFNEHGVLPAGIHDCTLEEAKVRLGAFEGSDRRPQLWEKFMEFIHEAKASSLVEAILVNGSFVSSKPDPNDIDLVLVVVASHDFGRDLPPAQYSLLSQQRVRSRFGFDIVVVKNGSENLRQAIGFFQQVRQQPGVKKGILKITI